MKTSRSSVRIAKQIESLIALVIAVILTVWAPWPWYWKALGWYISLDLSTTLYSVFAYFSDDEEDDR